MKKNNKTLIIGFIVIVLVILGYIGFQVYSRYSISKDMKKVLYDYFENNNVHISSNKFTIDNVEILCKGKDAYIVEFNISFEDDKVNNLENLNALVNKNKDSWDVKSFSGGITAKEINSYKFRCYKKI